MESIGAILFQTLLYRPNGSRLWAAHLRNIELLSLIRLLAHLVGNGATKLDSGFGVQLGGKSPTWRSKEQSETE